MQLDKKSLERLLLLDDAGLWAVICAVAAQSGIRLPQNIRAEDLAAIRRALGGATDSDIANAASLLEKYKQSNGG